jgi:hypothetical protein
MLNLLGKALTGMVLDRDARDAMRDAGGLASTIQGAADMRQVIQALQAARPQIGGSTPLPPPPLQQPANPAAVANSAALQAALLAQILAEARATAAAAEKTAAPRNEPTLNVPRAPQAQAAPAPSTRPPASTPAGGLNAAIMAQALAAAQAAIANSQGAATPPAAPAPQPTRGKRLPSADRALLIQNALKVHSAKQTILSNLSDEQRAKLTELATKLLDPSSGGSA